MLGKQIVFLYKNGLAEPVEVETGIRTSELIQVVSGINANDTIITTGLLHLKKGMTVVLSDLG